MALKGDRHIVVDDISYFMSEVAEKGGVAVLSTAGSGVALDQSAAVVTYDATPSGSVPIGLLLNDMVNVDQTRYHINFHKDEVNLGGKVTLLRDGWVTTDKIYPGVSPAGGNTAYLEHSGLLTTTSLGDAATPKVGQFMSSKDEDGYAKVYIKLPQI
jgi:hypothetical protein